MKKFLLLGFIFISACSFPKLKPEIYSTNINGPLTALVLGEGLARSYAHIGVIKALAEAEIPFHMLVTSGTGSLIGALYANRKSANDLEWHGLSFKRDDYLDFSLFQEHKPISGEKIEKFLSKRLAQPKIEKLPLPFYVTATDLKTGQFYLFEKGSIVKAVQAGMAIPGIFEPIAYDDKLLVSGEISQGIPVDVALQKGADFVIAVDLIQGIESYHFKKPREVTIQSYKITSAILSQNQLKQAHLIIRPEISHISFLDFSRRREVMLAGYTATKNAIPELRDLLDLKEED
ncbi:MAG: patatin-like phospholipase family protein [Deltaproteobacteria bacterium]